VNPQVWSWLRNCRALTPLSPIALQEVLAAATERSFQAGEAMMTQGDPAEGLLILLEGKARALLRSRDGQDRCIGRFTSGDVVGEMALVTREPRSATVVADTPVRALLFTADSTVGSASLSSAWCSQTRRQSTRPVLTTGSAARVGWILRCVGRRHVR
jgi:signal-transduction protein with cAMP-binding, CBS, and nucleotidyltransferase domain